MACYMVSVGVPCTGRRRRWVVGTNRYMWDWSLIWNEYKLGTAGGNGWSAPRHVLPPMVLGGYLECRIGGVHSTLLANWIFKETIKYLLSRGVLGRQGEVF